MYRLVPAALHTPAEGFVSPRHASPQEPVDDEAEAEELPEFPAAGAASRAARKQLTPPVGRSESSKLPCDERIKHLEEKIARCANPFTPLSPRLRSQRRGDTLLMKPVGSMTMAKVFRVCASCQCLLFLLRCAWRERACETDAHD